MKEKFFGELGIPKGERLIIKTGKRQIDPKLDRAILVWQAQANHPKNLSQSNKSGRIR